MDESKIIVASAAILVTLIVSIFAIKDLVVDFRMYIKLKRENNPDKCVMLNGCYQVVFKLMTMMDMVLQVYVAQSLCSTNNIAELAVLAAIPSSTFYLGMWIGSMMCPFLILKLGNRTSAIIGGLGCVFAYCLMLTSVGISSLTLYSIANMFKGLFAQGVLFIVGDNIPFIAKEEKNQKYSIMSSQSAALGATVVATLLGGYIGEFLSYFALYCVITCLSIIMLLLCLKIFDNNTKSNKSHNIDNKTSKNPYCDKQRSKQKKNQPSILASWKLFLKPTMIVYVTCFLIPKAFITGYTPYLFPLFSSAVGLSAVLMSNINVFTTTFNYLTNKPINNFFNKINNNKSMVITALTASISMMMLFVFPNIIWAIVVLFIAGCSQQVLTLRNKIYVAEYAEKINEDPAIILTNSNVIFSFLSIANSPILSCFVSVGLEIGCALVGSVCATLTLIFGCKNKCISKKSSDSVNQNNDIL